MCFSLSKRDEEEIVVPVRLVNQPAIIKTAPTFPTATISAGNRETIILAQRSPHASQQSYRIERTSSRSPRTSDRQIIRVETRSGQLTQPLTPPGRELGRPISTPLQSSSPRTSTGRVQFIDGETSRVTTGILSPAPARVVPQHRRSTSQVIVIKRSPSQRSGPVTPRISDSLLVNTSGATYTVSRTIAPGQSSPRDPRIVEIGPRSSRVSQGSTGVVEIETATGRRSRRQSNVQAICTDGDPRGSGTWRSVREKYVVLDSKGNKTEYYR